MRPVINILAKPFQVLHVFTCLCVAKNAWRQNSCVLLVTLVVKPVRLDWQPVTSIRRGTESFVLKLKFVCNVKDTIDRCLFRPKTCRKQFMFLYAIDSSTPDLLIFWFRSICSSYVKFNIQNVNSHYWHFRYMYIFLIFIPCLLDNVPGIVMWCVIWSLQGSEGELKELEFYCSICFVVSIF